MGPHERRPVPLGEAGGAPDYTVELSLLCERYQLDRVPVPGKVAVSWMTDDGPVTEARDDVRDLVLYLRARFGAR
jgi:hypothetical protein